MKNKYNYDESVNKINGLVWWKCLWDENDNAYDEDNFADEIIFHV